MSDDAMLLRQAAALMRHRACDVQEASPAPWVQEDLMKHTAIVAAADGSQVSGRHDHGLVAHLASWHPGVALAIADWLDAEANSYEANEATWRKSSLAPENRWAERGLTVESNLAHHHAHALTIARAYLGRTGAHDAHL